MNRFIHACPCCGKEYTVEQWSTLPFVGLQDDGGGGKLELRNCLNLEHKYPATMSVPLVELQESAP